MHASRTWAERGDSFAPTRRPRLHAFPGGQVCAHSRPSKRRASPLCGARRRLRSARCFRVWRSPTRWWRPVAAAAARTVAAAAGGPVATTAARRRVVAPVISARHPCQPCEQENEFRSGQRSAGVFAEEAGGGWARSPELTGGAGSDRDPCGITRQDGLLVRACAGFRRADSIIPEL